MAGAGADVWKITGEDRAKHDAQFFQLKPVNGFVTGDQAKGFFMQSGLSTQVLGQIWTLADMNGDGKMDKKEFSIAMHLIKKKLQGYELPKALPPSLKADPSPFMGSFGVTPAMPMAAPPSMAMGMPPMAMGGMGGMRPMGAPTMTTGAMGMPIMANGMQQLGMQPVPPNPVPGMMAPGMAAPGMVPPAMGVPGIPATTMAGVAPPATAGASGWAMPHTSKLKYTQLFNTNDRKKCGFLTGVEARAILVTTGLPQPILAQIWNLSDVDKDGKLTCDEFCLALHLSDLARQGKVLPATLPPELLPSRTRSGSLNMAPPPMPAPVDAGAPKKDAFGDLLGSMGMPPPQLPTLPAANGEPKVEEFKEPESFEDKRKKNFDAGQAILDQKRAQLQEQFRQMEQERLAKERQEQEKRERQRQEQERKRQMELERKMEKQRQLEMEREEQRKKQMEAREAARREVERQRQMEWEQQRKMQLLAEKHREYEQLSTLKAQFGNLKCELDSLEEKKMEINSKIQQVRNGVTDFTTSIEKMRESRDSRLGEISRLEQQIQELSSSFGRLHSDKEQLTYQVQTSVQNTPLSDTHRTVMHSVELKKTNLQRLKKELEQLESDTESNLSQIDIDNAEMERLQRQLATLQEELPRLQAKQRQRQAEKQAEKQALARKKEEEERQKEKAKLEAKMKKAEAPPSSAFSNGQGTADGWDAFGSSAPSGGGEAWGGDAPTGGDAWAGTTAGSGGDVWGSDPFANQAALSTVPSTAGVKKKYRAVFDFEARSEDELTVTAGDVVEVFEGETMPGMENWVKGELSGRVGWIPNNYVEPLGNAAPADTLTTPASSTLTSAFSAFQAEAVVPVVPMVEEVKPEAAPVAESAGPSVDESALPSTVSAVPVEGQLAPEGMRAQALHPWKARQDNHLTFSKDEVINVRQQKDQWWLGELNGKTGWFPKAYVKVTDPGRARSANLSPANMLERDSQDSASISPGPDRKDGEYFVAMYPYVADVETDLSFNEGDMILVTDQSGEWWSGVVGDKTGTFPANYVKKVEMQKPGAKSVKKPEIAVVIAPYTATGPGQLTLEQSNMILVRQKSPRGWWEGELQARGQKRKIGWFPANYVKLLGSSSARSTPDPHAALSTPPTSSQLSASAAGSRSATPHSQPSQSPVPPPANSVQQVKALYAYEKQNEDELTFAKDSVITVLSQDNPDWWQGELDGQTGVFPSNYVVALTDSSSDGYHDSLTRNLSPKEKNRQNYIKELINTEETYMTDMSLVNDVFINPLKKAGVLTEEEVSQIFVNWNELIICNMKLLKALRVRKKMCGKGRAILMLGDILCENLPHMTQYVRFCSCQLSAAALLQRKSENSTEFQEAHKKCMRDPRTKGMPLSSFLLKPMQRITKYPLMIKEILKHTPEDHPDRGNLMDALARAEELCSEVNEGVRQKENADRLEWIQKHVHTDGLPEKITFNSGTNCLGHRKVLHSGVLYKAKSSKELMAYLFNDFLLLTQPSRPLGRDVSALFNYDPEINMMFKMYKTPIVLNEVTVKKPSGSDADPCQFTVTYIDYVLNLKAITETERDVWVKKIEEAAKHFKITEKKKRERAQSMRRTPGVGRLLVVIQDGVDLKASDANGKSDPYCEVSMGSQEHRTKVLQGTLNPKWNASMQFTVKDVNQDVLCITVYDRDLFSPNDFLGRTEVRVKEVMEETRHKRGPVAKCLTLHEVDRGKVSVKLDLQLFDNTEK